MSRRDKMAAIARYLTAASGVPMITYNVADRAIDVPRPYSIPVVTTDRKIRMWFDPLRDFAPGALDFSIRIDSGMDSPADMWVAMRGDAFAVLLGGHFDANRARIMGGER